MITCYTCLKRSTPAGLARQSCTLDLPRIAHHLVLDNHSNIQTSRSNHAKQTKLYIRIVHQQHKIKMKSLENKSTSRYEHTDAKITKIRAKTKKL